MTQHMMTTAEIAAYLRIKERKVYDLVASDLIPCTRVTGKLLFPKPLIDQWIAKETSGGALQLLEPRPLIAVGSHDPLLDWALRQANAGLATLFGGSLNGLTRFLAGDALFCGLHVPDTSADDPLGDSANCHLFRDGGETGVASARIVLVEWAKRSQGLILPPGNPHRIHDLADLARAGLRLRARQAEAGSRVLLEVLIDKAGLRIGPDAGQITLDEDIAQTETEAATAVADGDSDAAFGIAAVAKRFGLDFVPLVTERYDIAIDRRDYFEPPFQALLALTRSDAFQSQADRLGGYDTTETGRVRFNG